MTGLLIAVGGTGVFLGFFAGLLVAFWAGQNR